jgi:hypothetical protein
VRSVAIIASLLLALSSSGFTLILHSCLMAGQSCCDRPMSMMSHMPWENAGSPEAPVLKSNMACCAVTVAGGLNVNPIVAGSQYPAPQHLDLIALLPPSIASGAQQVPAFSACSLSLGASFPPSVEKYVLNASFLI